MKYRFALALFAVMSAPLTGWAADANTTITDEQLSKMQEQSQLSDEQVAKMRQIREEGGSRKDMRAVMTDEQKKQAQAQGNEAKSNISDEQLGKMRQQLNLSDEQVAKMRQIREEGGSRSDVFAVLTDEQKAQAKEMKKQRREKNEKGQKDATLDAGDAAPASKA